MAHEVGGWWIASEEGKSCLPGGAFCPKLVQVFDSLAAQLLTRGWIRGDLNGIFYLARHRIQYFASGICLLVPREGHTWASIVFHLTVTEVVAK